MSYTSTWIEHVDFLEKMPVPLHWLHGRKPPFSSNHAASQYAHRFLQQEEPVIENLVYMLVRYPSYIQLYYIYRSLLLLLILRLLLVISDAAQDERAQ